MAFLYVTEYAEQARDPNGMPISAGKEPALASNRAAIAVGSTDFGPLNAKTRFVRLHADAICSVRMGIGAQTAVATDARFAANQTEFRSVAKEDIANANGVHIANIQNT